MLASALQAFASRGINLTSLQSRPERTVPWAYRFYVDVQGGASEPRLAEALEALEALVSRLVVLGSYREWNDGTVLPPRPCAIPRTGGRSRTFPCTTAGSGPRAPS